MAVRSRTLCGVVALVAGLVTLAIAVVPELRWAYRAPSLRIAIETAAALAAVVVAYIVIGRFLRSRRLDHLGVAAGLLTLAASNALSALDVAAGPWEPMRELAWGAGLAGILVIAVAAFLPDSRLVRSGAETAAGLLLCVALALVLAAALDALFDAFPLEPGLASQDPREPFLSSHPVFVVVSAGAVLGLAAAALGFARDAARRPDDALLAWLAVAMIVGAFGRVHSFLFPPVQTEWVYTGTLFRLAFYLVLLVGAAIEVERYWRGLAAAAVLEERRRIARDLHDGVAQELAFIDRASRRLAATSADGPATQIAAAAARGLADSRRAIAALTRPLDEPLEDVLAQAAEDVAARTGLDVSFELARGIRLAPEQRETLVRIACEAVANAAVHGHARGVRVELSNGRCVRMRVVDDGVGFDPHEARAATGFGLVSMRERAEAVGAAFRLRARPGAGTAVEVELP